jgi:hypothetical protein
VPRHVARLFRRIVAQLVVDYFAYVARLGASAHRGAHRLSSTASPTPRDKVPRHVVRLITRLVAPLVVDNSASRRLVVDYFASAALRVPRHVARLVAPLVVNYSTSCRFNVDYSPSRRLVVDNSASRRLVIDYFASAERPGASARRASRHSARRAARRRLLHVA